MKKLIIAALLLCSLFALCACGGNETEESSVASASSAVSSEAEISETVSETESSEAAATFSVTVVDGDGNKISGVMLQVCKDSCVPAKTNENGVAVFNVEITDGYKLSVMTCPEGYSYNGDAEVYLESGITEYTLTIEKDAE